MGLGPALRRETDRGVIEISLLAPNVHLVIARGHMDMPHVELLMSNCEQHFTRSGRPQSSFQDWLEMTSYDSKCRQALTSWMLRHPEKFDETHIAQRAKLVAMGVQVANLLLGSRIRTHSSRASLDAEMARFVMQRTA